MGGVNQSQSSIPLANRRTLSRTCRPECPQRGKRFLILKKKRKKEKSGSVRLSGDKEYFIGKGSYEEAAKKKKRGNLHKNVDLENVLKKRE